ncbi:TetR/AcrR family transcriptional regulator [Vibrio fluvialis]|nr:TetR/AcrR family transcriptional regulator [Vibrio fluvialis]
MARPKEFNIETALDAATLIFREYGYSGTSTQMLIKEMKIGKQSLYDTFGGKWQLYCTVVARYCAAETAEHVSSFQSEERALNGINKMMDRVVTNAHIPCLGVNSVCEFSTSEQELVDIRNKAGKALHTSIRNHIKRTQQEGDLPAQLNPDDATHFLLANIAGIRIAARGGASSEVLHALKLLAIEALK